MGQRLPPPFAPSKDEVWEDSDGCATPPSARSGTKRLVGRISEALGVLPAALYEMPPSEAPPSVPASGVVITEGDLDSECVAVVKAYRRIQDPAERRRLLILMQQAAEPV